MKKLLFALISLLLTLSITVQGQELNPSNVTLTEREKGKGQGVEKETGNTRSITSLSVSAYLYNNTVSIYFNQDFPTVTITVICEATGEVVHDESYNNPATLFIDLTTAPNGSYYIVIETEVSFWEGSFSL